MAIPHTASNAKDLEAIRPVRLRSIDLFTGAGGLALGIARAGFEHLQVIDSDQICCRTLIDNKKRGIPHARDWNIEQRDTNQIDFSHFIGLDLLSGGPPCQPFSQAGSRNGRSDARDMFPEVIRAIRECSPKAFIVENVKGLLSGRLINYFNYVIAQLRFPRIQRRKSEKWTEHKSRLEGLYTGGKYDESDHYKVIWDVLDAADFGVAQRRRRVFIVGVRADLGLEYSFPLQTHTCESLWIAKWVNGSYWERHRIRESGRSTAPPNVRCKLKDLRPSPSARAWRTVRDAISGLPNVGPGRTSHMVLNHFFNPGARTYQGHEGCALDAPAKTIKAGRNGVPGGENILQLDDGRIRYFSVRECARLQGFPDEWAFDGSWCAGMRQIGNAVPVTLAEVVARPLAEALSKNGA